jgi:hypothetical protein
MTFADAEQPIADDDAPSGSGLRAPFPYFGGKSGVAGVVWAALGDVPNYIEPFFGSGAVLLARPGKPRMETVNDADGMLANFWRAVKSDPGTVAEHADWPVNESDLHARHLWLVGQREPLTERLMGDPDWFDAKAAGWWVWGIGAWIGGGWCSGEGPWVAHGGRLTDRRTLGAGDDRRGMRRRRPNLSGSPTGAHRLSGAGVNRRRPRMDSGMGIHVSAGACGRTLFIRDWFARLARRLREVRVACGDWGRIATPAVLFPNIELCGVFLDPPYAAERAEIYVNESFSVAHEVRAWCAEHGGDPRMRIVLAGYAGEHDELEALGWRVHAWKTSGGYAKLGNGRGKDNAAMERLWFSPHCIQPQRDLFGAAV